MERKLRHVVPETISLDGELFCGQVEAVWRSARAASGSWQPNLEHRQSVAEACKMPRVDAEGRELLYFRGSASQDWLACVFAFAVSVGGGGDPLSVQLLL
jgi:hypothetical protein